MLFGVFLGPIFAIILFNIVVFVLVIRVLLKHTKRKLADAKGAQKSKGTLKTLISISGVMLMFGLSWLFGAFTIGAASVYFQWLFVIFNALQGFYLFIFFCVIAKDAREEWLALFRCKPTRKRTTSYSKGSSTLTIRRRTNSGSTILPASKNRSSILSFTAVPPSVSESDSMVSEDVVCLNLTTLNPKLSVAPNLESVAEETVIANGMVTSSENGSQVNLDGHLESISELQEVLAPPDLQVPPHIFARLQRSLSPEDLNTARRHKADPTLQSVSEETIIGLGLEASSQYGSQLNLVSDGEIDSIPEAPRHPDLQVPPHIFARLQSHYYSLQRDDSLELDTTQPTQISDVEYETSGSEDGVNH